MEEGGGLVRGAVQFTGLLIAKPSLFKIRECTKKYFSLEVLFQIEFTHLLQTYRMKNDVNVLQELVAIAAAFFLFK